jgi:hypothetical protein
MTMKPVVLNNVVLVTRPMYSRDSLAFAYNLLEKKGYDPFWIKVGDGGKEWVVCRKPSEKEMQDKTFVNMHVTKRLECWQ